MALNFPPVDAGDGNPTDGMVWTAPTGKQWIYRSSIPGWQSIAPTGNSNIVYRGGIDLTQDPDAQFNDIESGNQFVVTTGATPVDGALYPGLGGQTVLAGVVIYDGNEWQALTQIPTATETAAGVVELADATEAVDETNNNRVLTPQRGGELIDSKIVQATTTVVGKTRYATGNEAAAGTETDAALTPASIAALLDRIEQIERDTVDTGLVMWMAGPKDNIPAGWLYCDGARIYDNGATSNLYNTLRSWGNPWGNGPSSDVVRIPDLRGRFIRGYADGTGRDPNNTQFGGSQTDTFESHDHGAVVNDPGHRHTVEGYKVQDNANLKPEQVIIDDDYRKSDKQTDDQAAQKAKTNISVDVQNRGGNETKPKNINLTPVIKL